MLKISNAQNLKNIIQVNRFERNYENKTFSIAFPIINGHFLDHLVQIVHVSILHTVLSVQEFGPLWINGLRKKTSFVKTGGARSE